MSKPLQDSSVQKTRRNELSNSNCEGSMTSLEIVNEARNLFEKRQQEVAEFNAVGGKSASVETVEKYTQSISDLSARYNTAINAAQRAIEDEHANLERLKNEHLRQEIGQGEDRQESKDEISVRAASKWLTDADWTDAEARAMEGRFFEHPHQLDKELRVLHKGMQASGAIFLPPPIKEKYVKALLSWGGMIDAPTTKHKHKTGGEVYIPTSNDTSSRGRRIGVGARGSKKDVGAGSIPLPVFLYTSDEVDTHIELVADWDMGDPLTYLSEIFAERIGKVLNYEFTHNKGDGPVGFLPKVPRAFETAASGVLTWQEVQNLIFSVDRAYRTDTSFGLMFSDYVLNKVLQLRDNDVPVYNMAYRAMDPDHIAGHRYYVNNDMPDFEPGEDIIACGAWRNYHIREVGESVLLRLSQTEKALNGIVIYAMFERWGGTLVNAGTNPIKKLRLKA